MDRSIGIHLGVNAMVGDDVSKANRHPRIGFTRGAVEFYAVEDEVIRDRVTGHQEQMIAPVVDIPRSVDGRCWSFCKGDPRTRLVEAEDGGNGVGTNSEQRRSPALEVEPVFVRRTARLGHRVFNPSAGARPLLKDPQGAVVGQGGHQQGAVVQHGQPQFARQFAVVGDGVLGQAGSVVNPHLQVRSRTVGSHQTDGQRIVVQDHGGVLLRQRLACCT